MKFIKKSRIIKGIALIFASSFLLGGCSGQKPDKTTLDKVQNMLFSMKTYETNANIKYISAKTEHTYGTKQQVKITGEYRIEVTSPDRAAGSTTVFDGKTICQYNSRVTTRASFTTTDVPERSELLLSAFLKNYLAASKTSVNTENFNNSICTTLSAAIPGNHIFLKTEKLWVDNTTLKPVKLAIYDPDGVERIVITYNTFSYNLVLNDSLFLIQQPDK